MAELIELNIVVEVTEEQKQYIDGLAFDSGKLLIERIDGESEALNVIQLND